MFYMYKSELESRKAINTYFLKRGLYSEQISINMSKGIKVMDDIECIQSRFSRLKTTDDLGVSPFSSFPLVS